MSEIKQEDIANSKNAAGVDDATNGEEPSTNNATEMDITAVDEEVKDETNDATTTTPVTTTANIKTEEPDDAIKEEMNEKDTSELKKEEEEEKVEDKEPDEKVKSSESGKKKRKKSMEGETTTTTTTETDTTTATKRSSRDRKSVEVYDPKIYDKADKSIQVIDGRGTALKNIRQCKDAMESVASSSSSSSNDELQTAFRFVYGSKYKLPSKKEMVQLLLDFNGYLPKKDSSLSKEEQEKADEELEAKFGARAYKLTIQGLKKLCDFFVVDRYMTPSKDGLVDKLLDFLGEPKKDKIKDGKHASDTTKTTKNTSKSKPTKRAKTEKNNTEEEDDDDEEKDANDDDEYDDVDDDKLQNGDSDGTLPSKEKLRKWVRAYVRCFHETKLTVNHALVVAGEKFGVDLLPMKADLKKLLIEEL